MNLCTGIYSRDLYGRAPIHIAAHWKIREMLRLLIAAGSEVDMVDRRGRTPLYVVVSSLSTGLYKEDLRYQVCLYSVILVVSVSPVSLSLCGCLSVSVWLSFCLYLSCLSQSLSQGLCLSVSVWLSCLHLSCLSVSRLSLCFSVFVPLCLSISPLCPCGSFPFPHYCFLVLDVFFFFLSFSILCFVVLHFLVCLLDKPGSLVVLMSRTLFIWCSHLSPCYI